MTFEQDVATLEEALRGRITAPHADTCATEQIRADLAEQRLRELEVALERIAWHELTWKEARDVAREALGRNE